MNSMLTDDIKKEISEIVECFRESITVFALYNTREKLLEAFRPQKEFEAAFAESE